MVDPRTYARVFRFDSKSPKSWLISAGVIVVGAALAAVALTVGLALAAVGVVAFPFLLWRRRKALESMQDTGRIDRTDGDPKVIDVEYEIKRTE